MTKSIHPSLKIVTYKMLSGETRQILSTYHASEMQLDIDPSAHPAWIGTSQSSAALNKKASLFGDLDFMGSIKS